MRKFILTKWKNYVIMLICKVMYPKGGVVNAQNLSAQKDSSQERARLQKENVYQERPQGSRQKKSQGQKAVILLISVL